MENKLIAEIQKEINLLDQWIKTTERGGWSTHNLESMKKRQNELKVVLFDTLPVPIKL